MKTLTGKHIKCNFCGKSMYRPPCRLKQMKLGYFCNHICYGSWISINLKGKNSPIYGIKRRKGVYNACWKSIEINCPICHKNFYVEPYRLKKTKHICCSYKCMGQWKAENLVGIHNKSWKRKLVYCSYCNNKLYKEPCEIQGRSNYFCNKKCYIHWVEEQNKLGVSVYYKNCRFTPKVGFKEKVCNFCSRKFYIPIKSYPKKFCSPKCCNDWRASIIGEKNPLYGRIVEKDVAERIRIANKKRWLDPIFVKRMLKSLKVRPNKPELKLHSILNELFPDEYIYTGDGTLTIYGKIPDFANINGKKKLIEHYGTYWHRNDNPQDRIDLFKKFGYDTLVIWQKELKDKEKLKNRLVEFHNRKMEELKT